ncbi:MAG: hypothetical protein ABI474_03885, partial [Actinomycetota bacterium]
MSRHGMMRKRSGRLVVASMAVIGLGVALGAGPSMAGGDKPPKEAHKVWICKYVGKPGDFETLKDGKQPISTDWHSTDGSQYPPALGTDFADRHYHSYVLALNPNNDNKYTGDAQCPGSETHKATLKLVKKVVNTGGGTAKATDWTLIANGPGQESDFHGKTPATHEVAAGDYALSETGPDGYRASGWDCGNAKMSDGHTVAVKDKDVTCTITNTFRHHDEDTAELTLIKVVDNTGGGTAKATDWTLMADGPGHKSDFHGQTPVTREVAEGTYTLSESGPSGYSASGWACTSSEDSDRATAKSHDDNNNGSSNKVKIGHKDVTCTITNTFVPPETHMATLTLMKNVVNIGGGTAEATAWTLDATDGPTAFAEGTTGVHQQVADGTYNLSETPSLANYSASTWDCTNAEVNRAFVIIGPNDEAVTCTITNTFVPPETHMATLTLMKNVVNIGGGTAEATAWTLDATDGPTAFAEGTTGVHQQVADGTYNLSETPSLANYSASTWDCTNAEVNRTFVVIAASDKAVTCTITNTFVPPVTPTTATLSLVKVVDNTLGGSAVASAWTLTATGLTSFSGLGSASSAVLPGTYTLSESGSPTSYSTTGWSCTPVANSGATVMLVAGQSTTCTIINTFVVTPTVVTPTVLGGVVTAAPVKVVKGAVVTTVTEVAPARVTQLAFTGAETVP